MASSSNSKTSKIVTTSQFIQKNSKLSSLLSTKQIASLQMTKFDETSTKTPVKNVYSKRNLNLLKIKNFEDLPTEILLMIFSLLNFDDLLNCTQVCKRWHNVANDNSLWSKWVKKYKCLTEYEKQVKNEIDRLSSAGSHSTLVFEPSYKNVCLSIMRLQSEKLFLKYRELLLTKLNAYTRQLDLKTILNDRHIINFEIVFYDKSMKCLYYNTRYKLNLFDMSASICWSDFEDFDTELARNIEYVRIYAKVSLYVQINSSSKTLKQFTNLISNSISNVTTKRVIIYEIKMNLRNLNVNLNEKLYENSLIQLYLCDKNLVYGVWTTKEPVKNFVFITFNLVYTKQFVNRIFTTHNEEHEKKIKAQKYKSNLKDMELDPKFGLHDYFVHFCLRNQTSSVFLVHNVDIFKTSIEFCSVLDKKCVFLNVIDSDNQHDVGPQMMMMPKFSWSTQVFQKNVIDLLAILDLCIQDSNKETMISISVPVIIHPVVDDEDGKGDYEKAFIASNAYTLQYNDKSVYMTAQINCLKDEFTYSNKSESFHLNKMKIWLSLDFINEWFSTKFN